MLRVFGYHLNLQTIDNIAEIVNDTDMGTMEHWHKYEGTCDL